MRRLRDGATIDVAQARRHERRVAGWDYFIEKVVPALIQGGVTLAAMFLGARFTRQAAERAANVQRELAVEADKRKADREDEAERRRERRSALTKLLDEQRAAYAAYVDVCGKWLARQPLPTHPHGSGKEAAEAFSDGVLLAPKLETAFRSVDFAHQAVQCVQGLYTLRATAESRYLGEQLAGAYARAMRDCIQATVNELGHEIPQMPSLPLPKADFDLALKEAKLRDIFAGRMSEARIEEAVAKLREMVRGKSVPRAGSFEFPPDEAPPNESTPSSTPLPEKPGASSATPEQEDVP